MHLIVYAGTRTLVAKLERMLQQFTFVPLREWLSDAQLISAAADREKQTQPV
jgi:hypothetical protein